MKIKIRKFKWGDLEEASALVCKTFAKFNSKEGSKKGIRWYIDLFDSKKNNTNNIRKMFSRTKINYVATNKEKIIGIIRGGNNKIINLYVDGKYHRKGIARRLVDKFEKECAKLGFREIKIKASIYAIPFYQKMGYKKTTGIRNFHGVMIQPMRKILKKSD